MGSRLHTIWTGCVVEAIDSGSAVYVTDGSYSRKIRSEIDGAGYMIYCIRWKKVVLKSSFYELCEKAGSYHGELLGLLAVHLHILAIEQFYGLEPGPRGLVRCNNLGGLNKLKEKRRKIPSSAKHADVLRSLRRLTPTITNRQCISPIPPLQNFRTPICNYHKSIC
jgi:hypothetical protein